MPEAAPLSTEPPCFQRRVRSWWIRFWTSCVSPQRPPTLPAAIAGAGCFQGSPSAEPTPGAGMHRVLTSSDPGEPGTSVRDIHAGLQLSLPSASPFLPQAKNADKCTPTHCNGFSGVSRVRNATAEKAARPRRPRSLSAGRVSEPQLGVNTERFCWADSPSRSCFAASSPARAPPHPVTLGGRGAVLCLKQLLIPPMAPLAGAGLCHTGLWLPSARAPAGLMPPASWPALPSHHA